MAGGRRSPDSTGGLSTPSQPSPLASPKSAASGSPSTPTAGTQSAAALSESFDRLERYIDALESASATRGKGRDLFSSSTNVDRKAGSLRASSRQELGAGPADSVRSRASQREQGGAEAGDGAALKPVGNPIDPHGDSNRGNVSQVTLRGLHRACGSGSMSRVVRLLDSGIDVNLPAAGGWTALHFAIQGQRSKIVSELLNRGADPNARSLLGDTPLHVAASHGNWSLVQLLVQNNADMLVENEAGLMPINQAASAWSQDRASLEFLKYERYSKTLACLMGAGPLRSSSKVSMSAKRRQFASLVRFGQLQAAKHVLKKQISEGVVERMSMAQGTLNVRVLLDFRLFFPDDDEVDTAGDKALRSAESPKSSSTRTSTPTSSVDPVQVMIETKSVSLFAVPLVKKFFDDKWASNVHILHWFLLCAHLVFLGSMAGIAFTIRREDCISLHLGLGIVAFLMTAINIAAIGAGLMCLGFRAFFFTFTAISALLFIEVLFTAPSVLTLIYVAAKGQLVGNTVRGGLAYANIIGWMRLGIFLLPSPFARRHIVYALSMARAFILFAFVFIIMHLGFSVLFFVLFKDLHHRYENFPASAMELYLVACGSLENIPAIRTEIDPQYKTLYLIMFVFHSACAYVGLQNWLIAMMIANFEQVVSNADAVGEFWRANLVVFYEKVLPQSMRNHSQTFISVNRNEVPENPISGRTKEISSLFERFDRKIQDLEDTVVELLKVMKVPLHGDGAGGEDD